MHAIVATKFKFRSRLINGNVRIKVHTDHERLETLRREDLDRLRCPTGRRSLGDQFLSSFSIELVCIPGDKNTVADVLSRSSYPSYTANLDVGIHGSQADHEDWDASESEMRKGMDEQLRGKPVTPYDEPHQPLPESAWGVEDLNTDGVKVNGVQVGCTLPVTGMDIRRSLQIRPEALAARQIPPSHDWSELRKEPYSAASRVRVACHKAFVRALATARTHRPQPECTHKRRDIPQPCGQGLTRRMELVKFNKGDKRVLEEEQKYACWALQEHSLSKGAAKLLHYTMSSNCFAEDTRKIIRPLTAY